MSVVLLIWELNKSLLIFLVVCSPICKPLSTGPYNHSHRNQLSEFTMVGPGDLMTVFFLILFIRVLGDRLNRDQILRGRYFSFFFFFFFFFCLFAISWAAPAAHGGSQARGPIGALATGLRQSRSNAGSEPCLQPTPQLTATPDR